MSRTRLLLAAAALLAGTAAPIAAATPASAVPGLVVVTAASPQTGSEAFKGANAICPRGTNIVGGGGAIDGGGFHVHLGGLNPAADSFPANSLYAVANEDVLGYAGSWTLTAWAVCASGVTGWEIVQADATAAPGVPSAMATAYCPPGKKVIGAGGRGAGKGHVILDSINVSANLASVSVEVMSVDTGGDTAHAYAICIDPVPGQQLVSAHTQFSSTNQQSLVVYCPAGTKVHGIGGGLTGALGQSYINRLAPNGPTLTTGVDINAREDADGNSGTWRADVQAICAT